MRTANLRVWIEVGTPSAERLHKASKASPRVVVFTHKRSGALEEGPRGSKAIHKADCQSEVYAARGPRCSTALGPPANRA